MTMPASRARHLPGRTTTARLASASGLLALLLARALAVAGPAAAATELILSTPFPAVAVEPGATASFDLTVRADTRERVGLRVQDVPDGWTATLRGGGFIVDAVFSDPAEPPDVELAVDVPADAQQGSYAIAVVATATGISDTLTLDLRVEEAAGGTVTLSADFPELRGPSDATFNFDLTLENDTPEEISASLVAEGPPGWQIDARPTSEAQAATATVAAGGSAGVTVEADPPDSATAGDYTILVRATGGERTAEAELRVTITGNFAMTLTTPDERLNATVQAGSPREVALVVINEGTAPLRGVELTASPPSGWEVTFEPAAIEEIPPDESVNVTAFVRPTAEAIAGDYAVSFTASTLETSSTVDIRTTVETSLTWAVVGVLLIVGTLLALGWVFQQYGRR